MCHFANSGSTLLMASSSSIGGGVVGAAAAAAGGGGGVVHRPRRERRGSLYAPGTLLLLLPTSIDNSKTFWTPTTKDKIINQSQF